MTSVRSGERADELHGAVGLVAAHAGRGLVQEDHARAPGDRDADLERALLGVGEHARERVAPAREVDLLEGMLRPLARVPQAIDPPPEVVAVAQGPEHAAADVLVDGEPREDVRHLEASREAAARDAEGALARDLLAFQPDRAARGPQPPAHQVEERGLARAVGTDDRVPLAARHRERDAADDRGRAEALVQVAKLERCGGAGRGGRERQGVSHGHGAPRPPTPRPATRAATGAAAPRRPRRPAPPPRATARASRCPSGSRRAS